MNGDVFRFELDFSVAARSIAPFVAECPFTDGSDMRMDRTMAKVQMSTKSMVAKSRLA
jgi:hypothetical protein